MGYIYSLVKERISEEARRFECISSRYGLSFCLMLIYCDEKSDIGQVIVANTRCADRYVKINDNYYALLFFANRPDSHATVAKKLLYKLETLYPHAKIAIGTACKEQMSTLDIVSQTIQNVLEAQESDMNTIIDTF